jgi:hypothetical protein
LEEADPEELGEFQQLWSNGSEAVGQECLKWMEDKGERQPSETKPAGNP